MNGEEGYDARTTKRSVSLMLAAYGRSDAGVRLYQRVDTPIGAGFGASAAAATSAVYAAASVLGVRKPKRELAAFAYRAEISEQTGLGTVSVIYDAVGAGAIVAPGEPGAAKFIRVKVPSDTRIVTVSFAPYDKKDALSSAKAREKINDLGAAALRGFLSDTSLDALASEGEKFSARLGLESPEVKKAIERAKSAGAAHASQNMIGYSVHALVDADRAPRVARALRSMGDGARVDTFEIGRVKAGVCGPSRR